MNFHSGIMVVCGFFAGAFVASVVHLAALPKAMLVGITAGLVSLLVGALLRPARVTSE